MSKPETQGSTGFDGLLAELEVLRKSCTEGAPLANGGENANGANDEDDENLEDDGESLAKSFKVEMGNGEEVELQDATELVKSMRGEIKALSGQIAGHSDSAARTMEVLAKSVDLLKSQGQAIAELKAGIAALGNSGRGRSAVVNAADVSMNKSMTAGSLNGRDFMLKADAAFNAGRISSTEIAMLEIGVQTGKNLPPDLIQRVLA